MSHLASFEANVNAAFERLQKAHDGLAADVDFLTKEVAALPKDELDADDQATVGRIEAKLGELADKFDALDALTVPPAPVPEPAPGPTAEDHG